MTASAIVGVLIIVTALGLGVTAVGAAFDRAGLFLCGMGAAIFALLSVLFLLGLALAMSGFS